MHGDPSAGDHADDRWRSSVLLLAALLAAGTCGCGGRSRHASRLSFEDLSDTSGLSRGAPLLTSFEPARITGGALMVRGTADLPDGTRIQIAVTPAASKAPLAIVQVTVSGRAFESPAIFGPRGPLPPDLYRFDVLAHFNSAWQPEKVMRATDGGRSLRGPGITRGTGGQPAFFLREERRL
jgi:hypothetical protein